MALGSVRGQRLTPERAAETRVGRLGDSGRRVMCSVELAPEGDTDHAQEVVNALACPLRPQAAEAATAGAHGPAGPAVIPSVDQASKVDAGLVQAASVWETEARPGAVPGTSAGHPGVSGHPVISTVAQVAGHAPGLALAEDDPVPLPSLGAVPVTPAGVRGEPGRPVAPSAAPELDLDSGHALVLGALDRPPRPSPVLAPRAGVLGPAGQTAV